MFILIAVPTYENVTTECMESIYALDNPDGVNLVLKFVKGYDCAKARNEIAKIAMDGGYDYVFMVDSDIVLQNDALNKLLYESNKDIVLGLYSKKYSDEIEIFKDGIYDYTDIYKPKDLTSGLVRIKGGGLGCALIKTSVFDKLKFPYFKYVTYDNGSLLSEDLYFCEEAAKADIEIYANMDVRCGHVGKFIKYIKKGD